MPILSRIVKSGPLCGRVLVYPHDNSFLTKKEPPKILSTNSIHTLLDKKKKDYVFVLGGGPSLKDFNFKRLQNEDTICVNCSVFDVPDPLFFVTKDYTFLKIHLTPNLRSEENVKKWSFSSKIFVAGYVNGELQDTKSGIKDVVRRIDYDLNLVDWIIKSHKQNGFGLSIGDFRCGVDSGYSGLQLAIILGYNKIYLLGYDMNTNKCTHYHKRYIRKESKSFQTKLDRYSKLYIEGLVELRQKSSVQIFSCSSISKLNQYIPYTNINGVLK